MGNKERIVTPKPKQFEKKGKMSFVSFLEEFPCIKQWSTMHFLYIYCWGEKYNNVFFTQLLKADMGAFLAQL